MSIPATMRALQQTSLNGPRDLRLIADAPVPVPGPGEVLVRVTAAGIGCGAFAEYTVLPAAAVMPVPAGWAAEQALGLAVNWPTAYELADGPKALAELETRATVGKLALLP